MGWIIIEPASDLLTFTLGPYPRSNQYPDDADEGKVSAEFKDGVLTIYLPKSEKAMPKPIPIEVKAA